jgi:hypothetical protein
LVVVVQVLAIQPLVQMELTQFLVQRQPLVAVVVVVMTLQQAMVAQVEVASPLSTFPLKVEALEVLEPEQ